MQYWYPTIDSTDVNARNVCVISKLKKNSSKRFYELYLPVISKVILPPERLPADITRIRPLIRMRSFVYQQIIALRELPVAILANKLLLRSHPTWSQLRRHWHPSSRRSCHISPQILELSPSLLIQRRIAQPLVDEYSVVVVIWGGLQHGGGRIMIDRLWGAVPCRSFAWGVAAQRRRQIWVAWIVWRQYGGGAVGFLFDLVMVRVECVWLGKYWNETSKYEIASSSRVYRKYMKKNLMGVGFFRRDFVLYWSCRDKYLSLKQKLFKNNKLSDLNYF